MHTDNKEAKWSKELHRALPQIFPIIGADRKNEVIILTGTGDFWLREFDKESWAEIEKTIKLLEKRTTIGNILMLINYVKIFYGILMFLLFQLLMVQDSILSFLCYVI
jgi:hypothetical protein